MGFDQQILEKTLKNMIFHDFLSVWGPRPPPPPPPRRRDIPKRNRLWPLDSPCRNSVGCLTTNGTRRLREVANKKRVRVPRPRPESANGYSIFLRPLDLQGEKNKMKNEIAPPPHPN